MKNWLLKNKFKEYNRNMNNNMKKFNLDKKKNKCKKINQKINFHSVN